MGERLGFYVGMGFVSAIVTFIGLAAFMLCLKRFDLNTKVPSWMVFVALWILTTLAGFVGGNAVTDVMSTLSTVVLIIGILAYIVSLPFGRKKSPTSQEIPSRSESGDS